MLLPMLLVPLLVATGATQDTDYCYADMTDPYLLFGSATAYEKVNNMTANPVVVDQCQPVQFWLLARHGTRYADADQIPLMQNLYDLRDKIVSHHEVDQRGRLCAQDLENLKRWTLQVVTSVKSDLTSQGYADHYNLAQRFQARFPTLLNQTPSQDLFKVRFTTKQRTGASAFAFTDGLFGTGMGIEFPEPLDDDLLIKPYKACKKWLDDVDENPDTADERNKFDTGALMTALQETVSQRLGFNRILTIDEVSEMYDMCRFDKGWHISKLSPWCAAFSEEELQLLEYREDLLGYYNHGYGNDLNMKVGCPPIKDFLDRFSDIEKGGQQPAAVLYFTHSTMLQLFFTPLGIAEDQQALTHTNYETMKNRQWRTSVISPFATNFAAIFFKCTAGEPYRVQLYLNEHPLSLDGCNQGLCDWSVFKNKFGSISDTCNLDFC